MILWAVALAIAMALFLAAQRRGRPSDPDNHPRKSPIFY